jgi:hypothetical protein
MMMMMMATTTLPHATMTGDNLFQEAGNCRTLRGIESCLAKLLAAVDSFSWRRVRLKNRD